MQGLVPFRQESPNVVCRRISCMMSCSLSYVAFCGGVLCVLLLQVGYDVGENPEAMLAAAASGTGPRAQRCPAADEQHKHAMLARLSSLRSRPGS